MSHPHGADPEASRPGPHGVPQGGQEPHLSGPEPSTKERLLENAVQVFAARGYQAATVREICQAAGTNVAAVNYHFGGKETLYRAVLWRIFEEHEARAGRLEDDPSLPTDERLAVHIRGAVRNIYGPADEHSGEPFAIFLMEMAHPSAHLPEIVDRFIRPDHLAMLTILRDHLGPAAPDAVLQDCCDSIWGQILHHVFAWPIDRILTPGRAHPSEDPDALAEHIVTTTLGGLAALKSRYGAKEPS
jgi:AcrR family transcriptional regulator